MKGSDMTHDDALVERVSDAIWSWTEGETPYVPASEIIALVQADLAEKMPVEELSRLVAQGSSNPYAMMNARAQVTAAFTAIGIRKETENVE